MGLTVHLPVGREEKILSKFYDKMSGSYMIPTTSITKEVLDSLLHLMKFKEYIITGIYDLDGEVKLDNLKSDSTLGYIVYKKSDLNHVKSDKILDSHMRILNNAFKSKGLDLPKYFDVRRKIPIKNYMASSSVQQAVDEALYLGMLNPHKNDGYTLCMGIEGGSFVFMEAYEVGY